MVRSLFVVVVLASAAWAGGPAKKAKPVEPVLFVAWNGAASPIACLRDGRLVAGNACKGQLRSNQLLRTATGTLTTSEWNPLGTLCPWNEGDEDSPLVVGRLALCPGERECSERPAEPQLAVWPAQAGVRFAKLKPLAAGGALRQSELGALATLARIDPTAVHVSAVFAADLNNDGRVDRVVHLEQPAPNLHELGPLTWTFVLVEGAGPVYLAHEGCSGSGTVDLDADGKMELVMRFQYQFVLFRLDGSVGVANAECCGAG